jgi:fimbrial chaperone protein
MNAIRATGLSLLLVAHAASGAGALRVAPTRLDMPQDQRAVSLTVTNTGSGPTLLQVEVKHWSQETGVDDYSAADDLVVSPPIFTLDAGAEQVVRVGRRNGGVTAAERTWRLFVQEVPTSESTSPRELNVVLRIGVPIFATPPDAPPPELEWQLACQNTFSPVLLASNHGGKAVRLDELTVRASGAEHTERAVYVLTGATRALSLNDLPPSTRRVEVAAQSGQQKIVGAAECH